MRKLTSSTSPNVENISTILALVVLDRHPIHRWREGMKLRILTEAEEPPVPGTERDRGVGLGRAGPGPRVGWDGGAMGPGPDPVPGGTARPRPA